jgi:hypothetical protein
MALTKLNFGGTQQALVAANIPTVTGTQMPAGTVIQTVTGVNPGATDSEVPIQGAYAATGFYVDITPTSTSNIIVVTGRAMGGTNYSDDGSYMELFRKIGSGSAATTNSTEAWLGTDYHNNYAAMQVPKSNSSYYSYMNKAHHTPTQGRTHLIAQEIKG